MKSFNEKVIAGLVADYGYSDEVAISMAENNIIGLWEDLCDSAMELAREDLSPNMEAYFDLSSFADDYSQDCVSVDVDGEVIYLVAE